MSSKSPVVTLTPAPTLDRTYYVHDLIEGGVNRADGVAEELAGKGINVTKGLNLVGMAAPGVVPIGDSDPSVLARTGHANWLLPIWVDGTLRVSTTMVIKDGATTKVNEAPRPLSAEDWQSVIDLTIKTVKENDAKWLVIAGALPIDKSTGKYNVGGSGEALKGGSAWMTLDEIEALSGPLTSTVTMFTNLATAAENTTTAVAPMNQSLGDNQRALLFVIDTLAQQRFLLDATGQANTALAVDMMPVINLLEQQGTISAASALMLREQAQAIIASGAAGVSAGGASEAAGAAGAGCASTAGAGSAAGAAGVGSLRGTCGACCPTLSMYGLLAGAGRATAGRAVGCATVGGSPSHRVSTM